MFSVMIVGCGKIAGINKNSHARAILANKNLNLKVCVDNDKEKADYFSKKFNCISYTNLQKALTNEKFNIIFADPPYEHREFPRIADLIFESKTIEKGGLLIYEHYKDYVLPDQYIDFKKVRDKKYGDSRLSIYKLIGEPNE